MERFVIFSPSLHHKIFDFERPSTGPPLHASPHGTAQRPTKLHATAPQERTATRAHRGRAEWRASAPVGYSRTGRRAAARCVRAGPSASEPASYARTRRRAARWTGPHTTRASARAPHARRVPSPAATTAGRPAQAPHTGRPGARTRARSRARASPFRRPAQAVAPAAGVSTTERPAGWHGPTAIVRPRSRIPYPAKAPTCVPSFALRRRPQEA